MAISVNPSDIAKLAKEKLIQRAAVFLE